jgi:hypothetical protein
MLETDETMVIAIHTYCFGIRRRHMPEFGSLQSLFRGVTREQRLQIQNSYIPELPIRLRRPN